MCGLVHFMGFDFSLHVATGYFFFLYRPCFLDFLHCFIPCPVSALAVTWSQRSILQFLSVYKYFYFCSQYSQFPFSFYNSHFLERESDCPYTSCHVLPQRRTDRLAPLYAAGTRSLGKKS